MAENINNEIQIDIPVEEVEVEKIKRKVGRPNTTGLPSLTKETATTYHNDYYHIKRCEDVTCECGALVSRASLTRHKKRSIHIRRMKKLDEA